MEASNTKDLVIIGAGDFGREMANVVERINAAESIPEWNLIGFIDDNPNIQGTLIDGYKVIGTINNLNEMNGVHAICSLGVASTRKRVLERITNPSIKYATLIDPDARIYKDVEIDEGSIVCGGSILAIHTRVGKHVVINLNCTLGHDDIVEDYCVINPGVNISGKVIVRQASDLGTGAKVLQGLQIGPETTVGAGGVVIKSMPEKSVAVGVPAQVVKLKE